MGVLDGRVAIVTGGGSGVGRGLAYALAGAGAAVAVGGRREGPVAEVADEIRARGGTALSGRCDVGSREEVDAFVARVAQELGRIDVLVNNAYSGGEGPVAALSEEDLLACLQSGPIGTLRMMQACLPHLRETKGSIVNFGSGAGLQAPPGMAAYAMAKESIRTLSRVSAVEWGRWGVRVNVVCPLAESEGFTTWQQEQPEVFEQQVLRTIPLGYIGDAETDIGRVVVFLAGPDSGYITGTTMMADGGWGYLR